MTARTLERARVRIGKKGESKEEEMGSLDMGMSWVMAGRNSLFIRGDISIPFLVLYLLNTSSRVSANQC